MLVFFWLNVRRMRRCAPSYAKHREAIQLLSKLRQDDVISQSD